MNPIVMAEGSHGTGAVAAPPLPTDFIYSDIVSAPLPFDWSKGFNVEDKTGKLPVKDQGKSSSCFHGYTPVLMDDLSYKDIADVLVGDVVVSHLGRRQKVINTFQKKWQGTTALLNLWGDYRTIECTYEHPFYAIKRPEGSDRKEVDGIADFYQMEDLKVGDWVGMPLNKIVEDKTLHSYESDPEFLWLLGLYLAEGSTSQYGVHFSVNKLEERWVERISKIMSKYGSTVTCNEKKDNGGMCIIVWGAKWPSVFEDLGSKYCDKKRISDRLMVLDPVLQKCIVDGLADGDGHERRNSITIKSTSYEMLVQARTILLRNGIVSSFCKENEYDGKKQAYTLEYAVEPNPRYSFLKDDFVFMQIKAIEHKKQYLSENVYNLEVENDNSYQVNGLAVHNCGGQATSQYANVLSRLYDGTNVLEDHSARFIYSQVAQPGGGSSVRDCCNMFVNKGVPREKLFKSYENGKPPSETFMLQKTDMTAAVVADALDDKALNFAYVAINIDRIAEAVRDNNGCLIGINGVDNGTWLSARPAPPIPLAGQTVWRHFLYIGGAKAINGVKCLKALNSWGTSVGEAGWQWISEEYLNTFVSVYDEKAVWAAVVMLFNPKPIISFKHYFGTDLRYGDISEETRALQRALQSLDLFPKGIIPTPVYGNISRQAALDFMVKYNVSNWLVRYFNGGRFVGPQTRAKLNELFDR